MTIPLTAQHDEQNSDPWNLYTKLVMAKHNYNSIVMRSSISPALTGQTVCIPKYFNNLFHVLVLKFLQPMDMSPFVHLSTCQMYI